MDAAADQTKKKRGGYRPGSGGKNHYNEPTQTVSFMIPLSKVAMYRALVKQLKDQWKAEAIAEKNNQQKIDCTPIDELNKRLHKIDSISVPELENKVKFVFSSTTQDHTADQFIQ